MEVRNKEQEYGIWDADKSRFVKMKKGRYVAGYSLGILYLDECWYPVIPGNVANMSTYDYPVCFKVVPNCNQKKIHKGDPTLLNDIITVAREFEAEGAKAIAAACGFFGNFQAQVADAVDIPVYLSSVIQIPWIKTGLKTGHNIGMLTADAQGITANLLRSCGINNSADLIIEGLKNLPEFSAIVESRGSFDNQKVKDEVVETAIRMIKDNPNVAAILLECSDLPPYSADVQKATKLPVFDYITMLNWLHHSVSQKPYYGFI